MWAIAILILLTGVLYLGLRAFLGAGLCKANREYEHAKYKYDKTCEQNSRLKQENQIIQKAAEETTALYDITRDICKPLEEEQVFAVFRDKMSKYLELEDCRFLKSQEDLSLYSNYTILPLRIDKHAVGHLLARGVKEQDKDKFHILTQQFMLGVKRAHLYRRVQDLAIMDSLTQVSTRRYSLERLKEEIERSRKFNYVFSFLMLDVDHFKECNDQYGHLVGDAILKEIARTIKENIRLIDMVGRYGGEEFCVILTETDKEGARLAAERIRQAIDAKEIKVYDEKLKATVSIGAASFPADSRQSQALIENADSALYLAKQRGRNRVCLYEAKR